MKKTITSLFAVTLIVISLSGCQKVKDSTTEMVEDAKDSYNNVVDEATEMKGKLDKTVDQINNAATQVKEAQDAISDITN